MKKCYSDEKNVQILLAVLKAYGIKKVIASPALAPTNVLLLAVELTPALKPTAVFPVPFVLVNNAVAPTAVF